MKNHVLILGCKNYPPFSSRRVISGGMEVYVHELVRYLKQSFDFSIIAGYSQSDDKNVRVKSVPLVGRFVLQPVSLVIFSFFIVLWQTVTGKRYDLINAQTPLSGLIGYIVKKINGTPYVVTVHIFAATPDHAGWAARVYGVLERVVLRNADRVISAGYGLKRYLDSRYGFTENHVVVIHPGMDVVKFDLSAVSKSILDKLNTDDYRILFMGRLIEENGLFDLLKAITLLRQEKFKLYIAGNGNLENKILNFIAHEHLEDKIVLLGVVKGADKQYLIRNVNLSIRTSYHEVFPVAYLESVSVGVPVVATPAGDTPYLAEETEAITIVPMNQPEAIVNAIKDSMLNGRLSSHSIDKAREFIKRISWGNQSLLTEDIFTEIINNHT